MYVMSHKDDSSDKEIASAAKQVARVLQNHFDCGGDNPRPTGGIPMETQSRRQRLVEMASVFFESHTISSKDSSRRKPTKGRGVSRGKMRAEDILIDIDNDFPKPEVLPEFGIQRRSLRPQFPPQQARVDACTRVVNRGI